MEQFLKGLEPGSVGLDVGCGNGKYLAVNREVFIVASDRYVSFPCRISRLVLEYWISISVLFLSIYRTSYMGILMSFLSQKEPVVRRHIPPIVIKS